MNFYNKSSFNIAVVGATGLVGRTILKILQERNFPINTLRLFASAKSKSEILQFGNNQIQVEELKDDSFIGIDIALFSAGSDVSRHYAPIAAKSGCIVIDNSSAWRLSEDVPLIVPEANRTAINLEKCIIANPNCNVIPLAVVFKPLHVHYVINRAVISTYQSISGAGLKGLNKLKSEMAGQANNDKHRIHSNIIFHPAEPDTDWTNEEIKLLFEPKKILDAPEMKITATCVRLPFFACHCESVNLEFENSFDLNEIKNLLANSEGIILLDDVDKEIYPTPEICEDKDEVFVGRIRRDETVENGIHLWVVSDNIRKGAATNAVQIAEEIIKKS